VTRHVIAVAQMLMSALLIAISGGRIETHFHVFGSLVILSFYRDWRVLIPATLVVGLDHFIRGIYWPYSVYGVLSASPFRSVEHAAWVAFEDIFLVISCLRSVKEMRSIARNTAELEFAHHANQLIMDNSHDVICTIDAEGRFLSLNAASEGLFGYSPEELVGREYIELVHPEDRARTAEADTRTRKTGTIADFVNRYRRKDGTFVDVLWSANWSKDDRIFFCVAHDMTELQRNEKALREAKETADRANREKSDFLSRMSHELRTPLNAILGFGQLLERQNSDETQRSRVGYIMQAGRHLLDLINEVLDISRIEAGRLQLSLEPVCLAEAVAEAIDLMRPLAEERSVALRLTTELDGELFAMADRQRFKQVLLNLLANAVKYNREGGSVSLSVDDSALNKIRLTVSDSGSGIAPEKLSRLFTPFERLGAEFSTVEGTGLGLALCRSLIEAMNGTISVVSRVGEGSCFTLELPRTARPLARRTLQSSVPEENDALPGASQRVLYIEDNRSNLALVEQILGESAGIELLHAPTGGAGLEMARRHLPAVILLDLHLPDLPGWEVLAQLRSDVELAEIPVIVISADATAGQIRRLLAAGATDYLTKPIDISRFCQVLERTTARRQDALVA
jgi:PAS domain S-box-containing protein